MRLHRAAIKSHRSIDYVDIELGPFTVLFGRNNVGKTSLLEALFGVLAPDRMADPHIKTPHRTPGIRSVSHHDLSQRGGVVFFTLADNLAADDEIRVLRHQVDTAEDMDFPALPPDQVAFISDSWGDDPGLAFVDPRRYLSWAASAADSLDPMDFVDEMLERRNHCASFQIAGPKPKAVYLDWEFLASDDRASSELAAVCILQRSRRDPAAPNILLAPIRWLRVGGH